MKIWGRYFHPDRDGCPARSFPISPLSTWVILTMGFDEYVQDRDWAPIEVDGAQSRRECPQRRHRTSTGRHRPPNYRSAVLRVHGNQSYHRYHQRC